VCVEETVDASAVAEGLTANSSAADVRREEVKSETMSSPGTVEQTGRVISSYIGYYE